MRIAPVHKLAVMAVLCLCTLALAMAGAAAFAAQTITNTAAASWQAAGQLVSAASNTVSFAVTQEPVTVSTYIASSSASTVLAYQAAQCTASTATTGTASAPASQASVVPASQISIGDVFYFRISMPQGNVNPAAIDTVTVVITTASGDKETLKVSETGVNTGVFAGSVATTGIPPQPVQGDCRLSVAAGDTVTIQPMLPGGGSVATSATLSVLADPYGVVFDSQDGTPVDGATVSLVDAATGAPASVYASDGVTPWPSTVTSGGTVTDGRGALHQLAAGEYSFPVVGLGQYRIVITPPSPYSAPSKLSAAQLAGLKRADGTPMTLAAASWGGVLSVTNAQAVRVDIPLDRPASAVALTKTASRTNAEPGDVVWYTVHVGNADAAHAKRGVTLVDTLSPLLRYRPDSVRIDGAAQPAAVAFAANGSRLTIALGEVAPGATRTITYAASVRTNAEPGRAPNTITATDIMGASATAAALVTVEADGLSSYMTLLGEVTDGGCSADGPHRGIAGVRVMLEDGSFAITDKAGRYHFDSLVPGTHVAQAAPATLPAGGAFVNCGAGTRAAGDPASRFVIGQGGSVMTANFRAVLPEGANAPAPAGDKAGDRADDKAGDRASEKAARELEERTAAGAETDWLALGNGPIDFLFPATGHNPRAPAVRVVIRHRPGQTISLFADGQPVPKVTRDNVKVAADGSFAISIWRGVPLAEDTTRLTADVRNPDGSLAAHLARDVHFAHVPFQARLVPELSHLVADGRTRPVIAVRILDRNGRPVHAGLTGDVAISSPYESADAIDATQARALSGLGRNTPHWQVKGDDGIALIALAPTMASGAINLDFAFADNDQRRTQTLEGWVKPGDVDWTLVGLAEGSVGARTIADAMERTDNFSSDLGRHARTAFYAKGRVLGKFLLTLAYDSAKQAADQQLLGAIDPKAYYTVYGDNSSRRFDAASRGKLYVRVETATFYAIYGDVQAGFNQSQLARYSRTATGVKAEANLGRVHLQGFAARTTTTHRHDEIAGAGVSGPYPLSSSAILAGSETVTIEARDRNRPDVVLSTTQLTRYVDYTIDVLAGTITFKAPLLSRDADLQPQYAVIDYDVDTTIAGADSLVGAGRIDVTSANKKLRIGATGITDVNDTGTRTTMAAADTRLRLSPATELRAEGAVSFAAGAAASSAWLFEAEHHDKALDVLTYARSADQNFGVGQTGAATLDHRRIGVDGRYRLSEALALSSSLYLDDSLSDASQIKSAELKAQYRRKTSQFALGLASAEEHNADGTSGTTTTIEGSLAKKLLNNRLELTASLAAPLGSADAAAMPVRETLGARYQLNAATRLTGSYEFANASQISTRTGRIGLDVQPWKGAHATLGGGEQAIAEYGQRSFAAFGLTQSFDLTRHLTLDATFDSNKVLAGSKLAGLSSTVTGVASTSASGVATSTLVEDYTAVTLGVAWRKDLWSTSLRGEWRNGEWADRHGLTVGAIRQLGDGRMLGAGATWTHATGEAAMSDVFDATLALAWRPQFAKTVWLARAEFRSDAAFGSSSALGSIGSTATISSATAGTAVSAATSTTTATYSSAHRVLLSVSGDYTPHERQGDAFVEHSELSLFAAARYNFDAYDGYNLSGTTLMAGMGVHIGIGEKVEIGGQFSVRAALDDKTTSYSIGPSVGVVPARNLLVMVGYNIAGYRDADFSAANNTTKGVFASVRLKFDASTFGFLGLDRHLRR